MSNITNIINFGIEPVKNLVNNDFIFSKILLHKLLLRTESFTILPNFPDCC